MKNCRKVSRRDHRIMVAALVLLGLVAVVVVPVVIMAFILAPKAVGGLSVLAALPLLGMAFDGGGNDGEIGVWTKVANALEVVDTRQKKQAQELVDLRGRVTDQEGRAMDWKRQRLSNIVSAQSGPHPGQVSPECGRALGAIIMLAAFRQGKGSAAAGDYAAGIIKEMLNIDTKAALTSSDIPLPTEYGSEVVELVNQYGAARKSGTVFPLGAGSVKLPRLKTDTAFGLLAQSTAITQVSPQIEFVTFTAEKFGGLVLCPAEIDEDSTVAMGQFLARYGARRIAAAEDTQFFISTGAGSGVNGSVAGLCASTITNSKVTQMASTKTHYSDVTLANIRAVRAVVDSPALARGSYYMHPSFEQALSGMNTQGDVPYQANAARGATLDGFPIRWVDMLPAYSTSVNASKVFMLFGDLSFQYLGVRGGPRFDTSREAGFATDDVYVRVLERMTIGLMAVGAIAGLETAAS